MDFLRSQAVVYLCSNRSHAPSLPRGGLKIRRVRIKAWLESPRVRFPAQDLGLVHAKRVPSRALKQRALVPAQVIPPTRKGKVLSRSVLTVPPPPPHYGAGTMTVNLSVSAQILHYYLSFSSMLCIQATLAVYSS